MDSPHDVNVLCLDRHGHHWVYLFDDANRREVLRVVVAQAADPALPFTWRDAAEVSQQMRRLSP